VLLLDEVELPCYSASGVTLPCVDCDLVCFSESVKYLVLTSAVEDFEGRTLRSVPGLLGKLRYLALLCDTGGTYSHWGLEKVHGRDAADKAIRSSQRTLITQILRTPLRDLADDLERSATAADVKDSDFLSTLERPVKNDVPVQNFRASEKHFMSVLHTLSALAQNRVPANSRGE
jgi:hypothetical protein